MLQAGNGSIYLLRFKNTCFYSVLFCIQIDTIAFPHDCSTEEDKIMGCVFPFIFDLIQQFKACREESENMEVHHYKSFNGFFIDDTIIVFYMFSSRSSATQV